MSRVLIAGGGVCGASLAILLGRQGVEVELFERSQFPHEKPCGEGLMPAGVAVLERMGLAESVGGAPFRSIRYHLGDVMVEGRFPSRNGVSASGRGQRRLRIDEALFKAANETPGVKARTGANVDSPLIENGRVTGLIVDGEVCRGDLVVAADGLNSPLRKALGFDMPLRKRRFGLRAHFRVADGCEQPPWVDVFVGRGHELYVTPLPDSEVLVAALVEQGAIAGSPASEFRRWCSAEPELAARLDGAAQITELAGCSPLSARSRRGFAPGIVLLGDAAGFVDPITGGGMSQALVSAELLSRYFVVGVGSADNWLTEFERERRRMLRDYRWLTGVMLWLAGHPRLAAGTLKAMRAAPKLCSHLAGVSGDLRPLWSALPSA
jgi:2-polyprenyl-6-methoxyphenol hydroxylase-like FAD-dependent oxidoreductase